MAATLTGTPVANTASGGSVTIPADATAVYWFWTYYNSVAGNGLNTVTLNGVAPNELLEVATAATDQPATGVAAWYNPATGSRVISYTFDATTTEGPVSAIAFVKDGNTTAWRDADAANEQATNACSVTLTTVAVDLVIKFDQHFSAGTPPSLSAGWTNGVTGTNNNEACRLSYISAVGATQVCDSEDDEYSTVSAISIPADAGIQATLMGQIWL
jgi:hypothetical protein